MATIYEILFADDLVLLASTADELQRMIDIFNHIVTQFGQEISVVKTKVMKVHRKYDLEVMPICQRQYLVGNKALEVVNKFQYLGGLDTDNATMTAEIAVRKQRMQGSFAKYENAIFKSALSDRRKVDLFNAVVVMNGLFGCQVWNVTQHHVDELEAVHSRLLRRLLRKTTLEWSRKSIIEYAQEKGLKLFPIEWRMMKLQLRYAGHEVRVTPDRVSTLPHNMLFRGFGGVASRLSGGREQNYHGTIRRALVMCGLECEHWTMLAEDRTKWKRYLDEIAPVHFLKKWYEREDLRKEQRRLGDERRARLTADLVWERDYVNTDGEVVNGVDELDVGVESEDNVDWESEGEDVMGVVTMSSGRVVSVGRRIETMEATAPVANAADANAMASEAFIASTSFRELVGFQLQDNAGLMINIDIGTVDSTLQLGSRELSVNKRKQSQRERRRQKRQVNSLSAVW